MLIWNVNEIQSVDIFVHLKWAMKEWKFLRVSIKRLFSLIVKTTNSNILRSVGTLGFLIIFSKVDSINLILSIYLFEKEANYLQSAIITNWKIWLYLREYMSAEFSIRSISAYQEETNFPPASTIINIEALNNGAYVFFISHRGGRVARRRWH